jgi:hypothetical protein
LKINLEELMETNLPNPSGRTMALGIDSASNRNEYQESLKKTWGQSAAGA